MKLKITLTDLNWKSQFYSANIYGETFTRFEDNGLPSEHVLTIDDPKLDRIFDKTFPKNEFKPGKFTWMSKTAIAYVRKAIVKDFPNEKLTSLYIDNVEKI